MESFNAILKKEELNLHEYKTFEEARRVIFEFIESWYNRRRIHSAINYRTPEEIEVSTRYIGDIEQDKAKPSYEILIKICNLYNISLDKIFSKHLKVNENKTIEYGLYGYQNLDEENKKTIDYLINYFNRK